MRNSAAVEVAGLVDQLSGAVQALTRLVQNDKSSFTIPEWCQRHGLSESMYHKLRREGRGPRTMEVGPQAVRISLQADADWVAEREAAARADRR